MMEVLQTPKVLKLDSRHQSVVGGGCIHSDSGWKGIPAAWALGFDFGFGFGTVSQSLALASETSQSQ